MDSQKIGISNFKCDKIVEIKKWINLHWHDSYSKKIVSSIAKILTKLLQSQNEKKTLNLVLSDVKKIMEYIWYALICTQNNIYTNYEYLRTSTSGWIHGIESFRYHRSAFHMGFLLSKYLQIRWNTRPSRNDFLTNSWSPMGVLS